MASTRKLSAYIVKVDSGFAPNPFGRYCTLACCKGAIRRNANKEDIVIGTGSASSDCAGKLIYAMKVGEVVALDDYWKRFRSKRPSAKTPISRRGDNIWHKDESGRWRCVQGAFHNHAHRLRDVGGVNALVASEFYYFGRDAIVIDPTFRSLLAITQGHKNTKDETTIKAFWKWLSGREPKAGRIGLPAAFGAAACKAHRRDRETDQDDCEECPGVHD